MEAIFESELSELDSASHEGLVVRGVAEFVISIAFCIVEFYFALRSGHVFLFVLFRWNPQKSNTLISSGLMISIQYLPSTSLPNFTNNVEVAVFRFHGYNAFELLKLSDIETPRRSNTA
jgi:hypothetical protein